jgi:ribonuclease HII
MIEADAVYPGYGWSGNKGYGSADHYAAIDQLGPSELHRKTWLHADRRGELADIAGA